MPIQFFGGAFDVYGAMPYDADYKVDGVNGWLSLIGNDKTQSLEASTKLLAESADPTEKSIGLTFDKTEVVEADGTTYHIGSYLDADGAETFKIIECDGAIHWPTPNMGESALNFLEQFTK